MEIMTTKMHVSEPWFTYLMSGEKKVEGRKATPKWSALNVGQLISLTNGTQTATFRITGIREYDSIEDYLIHEGLRNALPGIETLREGIDTYRQWSTDQELAENNFLAIKMSPF